MKIRPTPPEWTPRSPAGRAPAAPTRSEAPAAPRADVGARPASPAGDRVELSAEARALQSEPAALELAVSAERVRTVSSRMGSGFYNRPDVMVRVLEGIANELGLPPR